MRWAGHVARVGERTDACRVLWGSLKERDHLQDLGVDGAIILNWILRSELAGGGEVLWTGLLWLG